MNDDPRKWVQVANDLRARIDAGELKPMDQVATPYEMQSHGFSKSTIQKALQTLEDEGRLKRYPGLGYFVLRSTRDNA